MLKHRIRKGRHWLIVGKTQSGKSTYVEHLVADYRKRYPRDAVIIVNHKNEKSWARLLKPVFTPPKYRKGMVVNWAAVPQHNDYVEDFLFDVWNGGRHGKHALVVIDEGMAMPQNSAAINTLYTQGASLGITMVMLTQRPMRVSISAVTQSDNIVIFNLFGKNDLERLDSYMVVNLGNYIRPATEKRSGKFLEKYHYLHYDSANGVMSENPPIERDEKLAIVANPKSTTGKPSFLSLILGK